MTWVDLVAWLNGRSPGSSRVGGTLHQKLAIWVFNKVIRSRLGRGRSPGSSRVGGTLHQKLAIWVFYKVIRFRLGPGRFRSRELAILEFL